MGKIELCGMRFYARHGCFHEEQVIGNHFTVDFEAWTDIRKAAVSDDLEDTLNYQRIYDIVDEEMAVPSHLLEHVAGRILRRFHAEFPLVGRARVSISKLCPPLGGEVGASRVTVDLQEL